MDSKSSQKVSIVEWAGAERKLPGTSIYTERYVVKSTPSGTLLAVVDGLAHTPEAQRATEAAYEILQNYTHQTLVELISKCDQACKGSTGAVVSAAILNTSYGTMTWYGIGNIEAVLIAANPQTIPRYQTLTQQAGILGEGIHSLREVTLPIKRQDVIVFATEAINIGFAESLRIEGRPRAIADQIIAQYAKVDADAMVLVARYLGTQRGDD
jgi:negative regulator of sigma-B (phosphoserine phosphatase)